MSERLPATKVSDRAHIRGHGWGVVPHWVYDSAELSSNEKLILASLSRHSGGDGASFPSVATLMGYTGLARRTVQYLLRRLEARGALVGEPQHGDDGRQTTTVYTIVAPPWMPGGEGAKPARGGRNGCTGEGATGAPPYREDVLTESEGTESAEPSTAGRSRGGASQEKRARASTPPPAAAAEAGSAPAAAPCPPPPPAAAGPGPAASAPPEPPLAAPGPSPRTVAVLVSLPAAWPKIRQAAAEAGVSEICARSEALREEVELHRPPVQVLAELLDMQVGSRARLELPVIADPDAYLRGWRCRSAPERTYGEAKRALQLYGLSTRPDAGGAPEPVGAFLAHGPAPPG